MGFIGDVTKNSGSLFLNHTVLLPAARVHSRTFVNNGEINVYTAAVRHLVLLIFKILTFSLLCYKFLLHIKYTPVDLPLITDAASSEPGSVLQ